MGGPTDVSQVGQILPKPYAGSLKAFETLRETFLWRWSMQGTGLGALMAP